MACVVWLQAQTVQQVQHVYQAQVQYVQEENNSVYTNGTMWVSDLYLQSCMLL